MVDTRSRPQNQGDGVINGVKYPLFDDPKKGLAWWREDGKPVQKGENGQIVEAVWDKGWWGGMGEGKRIAEDSVGHAHTENMDCSAYGFARLSERKINTTTPGGNNNDYAVFWAEEEDPVTANTRNFVYSVGATDVIKYGMVTGASTLSLIYTKTFTSGVAGRPAKFNGKWYFPWGSAVVLQELTRVNPELGKAFYYNGSTYTDNTTEARSAGGTPFTLLSGASDFFYWGASVQFNALSVGINVAAAGATVSWQYWNGAWVALTETDGTTDFTVTGEISWTLPGDWTTTTVNGQASYYWVRAVPSGVFGTAPTANSARVIDQFTAAAATVTADHFTNIQDGATAKLARATNTNKVDMASASPLLAASWSGGATGSTGFSVGDTSAAITSMIESGASLFVAKEDNVYVFRTPGVATPVFNILKGSGDSRNGSGSTAIPGTEIALYPHQTGLYAIEGDRMSVNIGPDRIPMNLAIPNITGEPKNGRHLDTTVIGNWIYSIYEVDVTTSGAVYILAGKFNESVRNVTWYTAFREVSPSGSTYLRGLYVDSRQRLWYVYSDLAQVRQLGADGSPGPGAEGLGRGTVSAQHRLYFPLTDFGYPHTLKQLRGVEVKARGVDADSPVQVKVLRDGGSLANVGATITSNGVSERFWTLGSSDTCYDAQFVIDITTGAGYVVADDDPQTWGFVARAILLPDHGGIYTVIIDTGARYKDGAQPPLSVKKIRDNLIALASSSAVACKDPDGNSINMKVLEVEDLTVMQNSNGAVNYVLKLTLEEYINA